MPSFKLLEFIYLPNGSTTGKQAVEVWKNPNDTESSGCRKNYAATLPVKRKTAGNGSKND
jgi:hypothetical protein